VADWRRIPEAGTVWGIRALVLLARVCGRRAAGAFLYVVAFYFVIAHGTARRASRDYLRRIGVPPTFTNIVRHIQMFAQVSLDRLFVLTGQWRMFDVEHFNHDGFAAAAQAKRGVLLLGAHLGSFEIMRTRARELGMPVHIVADFSNSERISAVLRELDPAFDAHLISLAGDPVTAMLEIRAAIEAGGVVAILGDRPNESAAGKPGGLRSVLTPFLGADAAFPAGPWLLAHALHCPVYFVAGLYSRPNRYTLHFELLTDEVKLDRRNRAEGIARYTRMYAERLEAYVRRAPLNWFNFYDFWAPPALPAPPVAERAPGLIAAAHGVRIDHSRQNTPP
jgi:predicted LPLAT superfamily acyltransferase